MGALRAMIADAPDSGELQDRRALPWPRIPA